MTVDFLPFANDAASANVVSQADYLAAASGSGYVQNGFPSGRADSNKANKALRQSSVMVAAIAQWLASKTGASVLDSGGSSAITTLTTQITASVQAEIDVSIAPLAPIVSPTFSGIPAAPTAASGTNTTQLATTSFVTSAVAALIPSGTAMLFAQTSAPTGWTKSTAHNDKMLRIVSGTASSGGSVALSTAWTSVALSGTVAGHTLASSEIPSHSHSGTTGTESATHTHDYWRPSNAPVNSGTGSAVMTQYETQTSTESATHTHSFTTDGGTGGGASHTHGLSINSFTVTPAYVDAIICVKT